MMSEEGVSSLANTNMGLVGDMAENGMLPVFTQNYIAHEAGGELLTIGHEFRPDVVDEMQANCSPQLENEIKKPKVGMTFDSIEDASMYYSCFAKEEGFAVIKRSSKKGADGKLSYVRLSCSRGGKSRVRTSNSVKPRPQSRIGCDAHVNLVIQQDGKWRLNRIILDHNHELGHSKVKYLKCNRVIDDHSQRRIELNDKAERNLDKTYNALQIEAGRPDSISFSQKDCRDHLDRHQRSLFMEGDAEAMYKFFMKMQRDNSDFFYAMDLDDEGQLHNVFWLMREVGQL